MLDEVEIEKIKKLINQGKTNYKIGIELRHSANTVKKIREEYKDAQVSHTTRVETHFDDSIGEIRGILCNIDNLIKSEQLKAGERKEWKKRMENIQGMLRREVDDKVSSERSNAIEERDEEWRKLFDQDYVKKDVVTDLNNMIKEQDTTIINLRNTIEDKDVFLSNIKYEMSQLKASNLRGKKDLQDQIGVLLWDNIDLKEEIGNLNDYIGNFLDDAGRWERKNLRHEKEVFNVEKTDFDRFVKRQQSNLDVLFFESDEKLKSVEKREGKLAEQKEKLKKREEKLKSVEKREGKLAKWEKGLKRWKDEQKDELDTEREKIQDDRYSKGRYNGAAI